VVEEELVLVMEVVEVLLQEEENQVLTLHLQQVLAQPTQVVVEVEEDTTQVLVQELVAMVEVA